jgi:uncharacterized membrane protein YfcA
MLIILAAALVIGLALGLFGSGGSILTVPVLLYLMQFPQAEAVASALGIVGIISFVALIPYWFRRQLPWSVLVQVAIPGVAGSVLGSWLSEFVAGYIQLSLLAVLMLLSAANMWRQQIWHFPLKNGWRLWLAGGFLGLFTGLVGVGGGFLIVPMLLAVTSLPMSSAIAASLMLVMLQSVAGFASHVWLLALRGASVDLSTILLIGGVGAIGSIAALGLSAKLPQQLLRRMFALFVVVLALFILLQQWIR